MSVNEAMTGGHEISMSDRSRMSVSGVSGVDCFNEEMVVLDTAAGALTISGEGLDGYRQALVYLISKYRK